MDNPPQNRGEFRQALLDKWEEIPVKCLERFVATMPRRLAAILQLDVGIPDTDLAYTKPYQQAASRKKSSLFVWQDLPASPSKDI